MSLVVGHPWGGGAAGHPDAGSLPLRGRGLLCPPCPGHCPKECKTRIPHQFLTAGTGESGQPRGKPVQAWLRGAKSCLVLGRAEAPTPSEPAWPGEQGCCRAATDRLFPTHAFCTDLSRGPSYLGCRPAPRLCWPPTPAPPARVWAPARGPRRLPGPAGRGGAAARPLLAGAGPAARCHPPLCKRARQADERQGCSTPPLASPPNCACRRGRCQGAGGPCAPGGAGAPRESGCGQREC